MCIAPYAGAYFPKSPKTLPKKKKKTDIIPLPLKFNTGVKQWQM